MILPMGGEEVKRATPEGRARILPIGVGILRVGRDSYGWARIPMWRGMPESYLWSVGSCERGEVLCGDRYLPMTVQVVPTREGSHERGVDHVSTKFYEIGLRATPEALQDCIVWYPTRTNAEGVKRCYWEVRLLWGRMP